MEQYEKINTINHEILQGLETAEVTDDAIQREHDKVNTIGFKVGSFIQVLEDFIEKAETAQLTLMMQTIEGTQFPGMFHLSCQSIFNRFFLANTVNERHFSICFKTLSTAIDP